MLSTFKTWQRVVAVHPIARWTDGELAALGTTRIDMYREQDRLERKAEYDTIVFMARQTHRQRVDCAFSEIRSERLTSRVERRPREHRSSRAHATRGSPDDDPSGRPRRRLVAGERRVAARATEGRSS